MSYTSMSPPPKRRGRPPKNAPKILGDSPAPRSASASQSTRRYVPYERPSSASSTFDRPPRSYYERTTHLRASSSDGRTLQVHDGPPAISITRPTIPLSSILAPVTATPPTTTLSTATATLSETATTLPTTTTASHTPPPKQQSERSYSPESTSSGSPTRSAGTAETTTQPSQYVAGTTTQTHLTGKQLWAHLKEKDGALRPLVTGNSNHYEALFFAIGIDPPKDRQRTTTARGRLALTIEGEVLCHLVNLYAIGGEAQDLDHLLSKMQSITCDTQLGEFSLIADRRRRDAPLSQPSFVVTYKPRAFRASARHLIRPFNGLKISDGVNVLDMYADTLAMGVSNAAYEWPPFPSTLSECITATARNIHRLVSQHPEHGTVIITPTWLQTMNLNRWLIYFDGHDDRSFEADVEHEHGRRYILGGIPSHLHSDPQYNNPKQSPEIKAVIRQTPLGKFLHDVFALSPDSSARYTIVDEDELRKDRSAESPRMLQEAVSIISTVLAGYHAHAPNTWKRTLYECRELVCAVVMTGVKIPVDRGAVAVLPFDMDSGFWDVKGVVLEVRE